MTGKIRIIAGQWRGRKINVADRPGLRPTGDRARETLFNWIGPRIVGSRVLDLFAGSGALGLEATSRGASRVVLVERDAAAARALREGPLTWPGAEVVTLVEDDALAWLKGQHGVFDLVLIDPPFDSVLLDSILATMAE
ncbi:MAG: 16S rRNA (guanine(966)-N(2))-methyltransferase RsmD, partial [Wenzhouxiangella sp.]